MLLQGLDERREKGDEPFGANPVCRVPHQEQRLLHFFYMVEEPHRLP